MELRLASGLITVVLVYLAIFLGSLEFIEFLGDFKHDQFGSLAQHSQLDFQ